MPTARASRTILAAPEDLWRIVSDPYHLPRWWPRVERVEGVEGSAFTEVMRSPKGKTVRADYDLVRADQPNGVVLWQQRLEGTPFARLLSYSETELRIVPSHQRAPAGLGGDGAGASQVTIEMRQELSGRAPAETETFGAASPTRSDAPRRRRMPSLGSWMLRRAAGRTISEALNGLERISG